MLADIMVFVGSGSFFFFFFLKKKKEIRLGIGHLFVVRLLRRGNHYILILFNFLF